MYSANRLSFKEEVLQDLNRQIKNTSGAGDIVAGNSNPAIDVPAGVPLCLSDGEINFLWSFMLYASIMVPQTREHLRRAWGFCQRHAWGWLALECSFREHFLHGPAILYNDIMGRALAVFTKPLNFLTWRYGLRNRDQCLMCNMGYGPQSTGFPRAEVLARGRDTTNLKFFAKKTRRYWDKYTCGLCAGKQTGGFICRPHFLIELSHGRLKGADIDLEKRIVTDSLSGQIRDYARSFTWEYRSTKTVENEASLITAIGWCSGWTELLILLKD
jgi:hypothetical protein